MTTYRFERCIVRPAWRTLEVDGRPAAIGGRAYDVLLALIEHRDRVLSKAELMALAWPGRVVEENNLEVQICMLRKAIGAGTIATSARRGYRFAATVETEPAPASMPLPHALPAPRGPLFGRECERLRLLELLAAHRLVTIVGAGGIGKTALALAVVRELAMPVVWVDLATVRDPARFADAIAQALGLPTDAADGNDATRLDAIAGLLATAERLVVFDNAEHLAAVVARCAARWLARVPTLRLLVTNQGRLGIAAERRLCLGPLELPDALATPEQAQACGAVALFADAVHATGYAFVLDAASVGGVVEVCRRLDGLPLAIELAAARWPMLGLDGLRKGLDRRFALLASNRRDAPDNQATLRASFDGTCGLLPASAQRLFRALGVCVGGFAYDLALAMAACDAESATRDLDALLDRSLIASDPAAPPRYRMAESARLYALEGLHEAGETGAAQARLCAAMASRCDAIATDFVTEADRVFLARHSPELDNLRSALDWAEVHDPEAAVMLASALGRIGSWLSLTSEALTRLDRAERPAAPLWVARRQVARSLYSRSQPLQVVLNGLRAAVATLRALDRPVECLHATAQFALRCRAGDIAEAAALLDAARPLVAAETRPAVLLHLALAEYGIAVDRDGIDEQRHWLAQVRVLAAAAGHEQAAQLAQWNLGWLATLHGDPAEGLAMAHAILAPAGIHTPRLNGYANGLALLLASLLALGRIDEARAAARRLVVLGVPLRRMHEFADGFALLCALCGACDAAARLVGYADAQAGRLVSRRDRLGRKQRDRSYELAVARLGASRADEFARQGGVLIPVQIEALLEAAIT